MFSTGPCITSVTSSCTLVTQACAQVNIAPPDIEAGSAACTVDATLADGTTLSFLVDFTFKGNDKCCGPEFDISPAQMVIGQASLDAGADG